MKNEQPYIEFGDTVVVLVDNKYEEEHEQEYVLCNKDYPVNRLLSTSSLCQALLGKKVGDKITYKVAENYDHELEILKIDKGISD